MVKLLATRESVAEGTREQRNQMEWKGKRDGSSRAQQDRTGWAKGARLSWSKESWIVNRDKAWPRQEINMWLQLQCCQEEGLRQYSRCIKKYKKKTVLGNGQSSTSVNKIFPHNSRLPDVWSSSTDSKYLSELHKTALPFLCQITLLAGERETILMSIPLYLIKAEIVGTSLMTWEKSSKSQPIWNKITLK